MNKREHAHMATKHRRWPLGTRVSVRATCTLDRSKPRELILEGRVVKHWRSTEVPAGCSVDFSPLIVDMCDFNGARHCHVLPFARLRRLA